MRTEMPWYKDRRPFEYLSALQLVTLSNELYGRGFGEDGISGKEVCIFIQLELMKRGDDHPNHIPSGDILTTKSG